MLYNIVLLWGGVIIKIELTGLPFPPSVNQLYGGKSRRYKTDKAKLFERDLDTWFLKNRRAILDARKALLPIAHTSDIFLSIKIDYIVHPDKIYTKGGKLKKIDVTNRIKAMLDGISELLGIDDNRFFLNKVEFLLGNENSVNIQITQATIRTVSNGEKD